MTLAESGDVIAYDGMLGTMAPEPLTAPASRVGRNLLILAGLFLGCWAGFAVLVWLLWLVVAAVWHHPVAGSLACCTAAIAGYVWHCKRTGIPL